MQKAQGDKREKACQEVLAAIKWSNEHVFPHLHKMTPSKGLTIILHFLHQVWKVLATMLYYTCPF